MFSGDFRCEREDILPRQRLITTDDILLFDRHTEPEGIILPEAYSQFLPVVHRAVTHEKTVRGNRQLRRVTVSVRQFVIQPGQSQLGDLGNEVHRDGEELDFFYNVSDTHPTQYYPHMASTPDTPNRIKLTDEKIRQGIAFGPFDIVWASSRMYHRAVPVTVATRRTSFRVAFNYSLPTSLR